MLLSNIKKVSHLSLQHIAKTTLLGLYALH